MYHSPEGPYEPPEEDVSGTTRDITGPNSSVRDYLARLVRGDWYILIGLFCAGLAVYSLCAWDRLEGPSENTHFVYLADTLNSMVLAPFDDDARAKRKDKRPFELNQSPPHTNDWASWWEIETRKGDTYRGIWLDEEYDGRFKTLDNEVYYLEPGQIDRSESTRRYFVSFPPGPAVLMMPLELIWGHDLNDVWFTIFFAALNIVLMYLVLKRLSLGGRTGRSRSDNLWLTALFAFGTAHMWSSVLGEVWFTALVVGVTFTLLYILFAIDAKFPFLAGCALALGFATRTPLVFASIFFFAFLFFPKGRFRPSHVWGRYGRLVRFCLPCLIVGVSLLLMNQVRFESLTSFGHAFLSGGDIGRIQDYGLFNIHFLSKNLSAMLTLLPKFQPEYPYVIVSKHGMSMLLTTPAFFYLFNPSDAECREDTFWTGLLWATIAVTGIPALLYQNTGYAQFGYRFCMDYLPFLICLLALGRRSFGWLFKFFVIVGIGVNTFGAITFKRFEQFYSDQFFVG